MKICSKCKLEKSADAFYRHPKGRLGLMPACIDCTKAYRNNRYKTDPEHRKYIRQKATIFRQLYPDRVKNMKLVREYGITIDEYNAMAAQQSGVCAICSQVDTKKDLAVDHCHATGKIRGLLCESCNLMLGKARDSIELLKKAMDYLLN